MLTIMKYGKLLHQEGILNVEVNAGIVSEVLSSSNGTYTHMLTRQYGKHKSTYEKMERCLVESYRQSKRDLVSGTGMLYYSIFSKTVTQKTLYSLLTVTLMGADPI